MQLTHKAIARAAGYRYIVQRGKYYWYDIERGYDDALLHTPQNTEQEAYADCCKQNGLVHE